jgi:hypothetical protein
MNRVGMPRTRLPKITPALLGMLQSARDTGDPWGGQFHGGRANVFRAAVRGGWLEAGTGAITEAGRQLLLARERRDEAA